jgi:Tfp pilus assembly protein PilV
VEFEPLDDFEEKLKRSFERWPAPPSLKHRLMQNRRRRKERPLWFALPREVLVAVSLCIFAGVFAALYGGIASYHAEQHRKGEEARQQVLLALRITNHALDHMNKQLAAHNRASQE